MKYFYIFVLFFYFPQLLFSQNSDLLRVARVVDSLIQVSRGLMNKREFPKAIEVLEAAKKTALEKWGKMSVAYGNALYYHSRALHGTRDYAAAEKLYVETLDIQEKILGPGDESYLTTLSRYGTLFSETKQFERAEPIYLKVQELSGRNMRVKSIRITPPVSTALLYCICKWANAARSEKLSGMH